ncbi:MAG: peptidoglycan-binding protein [Candidatus Paceibacterota bacterium]|jgi:peptidoglycan hydrolase-like protein with peptidoglycan-binding domain
MKKSIISIAVLSSVLMITFFISIQLVQAQVVNCPVGYICIPIASQAIVCPSGYVCTPIATNVNSYNNGGRYYNNKNTCTEYTFSTDLSLGSMSSDVVNLQTFLITKGFTIRDIPTGWISKSYFDSRIEEALRQYQQSVGLAATGQLDPATRAYINGSCSIIATSTPLTPKTQTEQAKVVTHYGTDGFSGCYIFTTNLDIGSVGPDVVALQTWLIAKGYNISGISAGLISKGTYDNQTASAVSAYQRSQGIPSTGFFGPLTRIKINSCGGGTDIPAQHQYSVNVMSQKTPTPIPTTAPTPRPTPTSTPTPTILAVAICSPITVDGKTYSLSPCNITATMVDGQGNKSFSATIVGSGGYGFSTRGYGVGFPTYGIIANTASGGVGGSFPLSLYFNDKYLSANGDQPRTYTGYLPIHIFHGSETGYDNNFLYLGVTLTVLPVGNSIASTSTTTQL